MTKRGVSLIYTWPCVWLLLWNSKDCLELRNDTVWRYCGLQCRTKSSDPMHDVTSLCVWNEAKCDLIYFVQCQISTEQLAVIVWYYSSLLRAGGLGVCVNHSPCNKASSYQQCRWPSVAPRWTWAQPQSTHCSGYLLSTVWIHEKFTLIKWYVDVGQLCHMKILGCNFQQWCYAEAITAHNNVSEPRNCSAEIAKMFVVETVSPLHLF